MAWIKIEDTLPKKPQVMELAAILEIDELSVVGALVRFWIWCDANLSRDCPRFRGTKTGLDGVAGVDGFTDAMIEVGWIELEEKHFKIPKFDSHLSRSAKTRAEEQKKKQNQRLSPNLSPSEGDKSGTNVPKTAGQDRDQRREEKNLNIERQTRTREQTDADRLAAEAAASEDDPVLIPAKMNTEPVMKAFRTWVRHLRQVAPDRVPPPGSDHLQQFWRFAADMGPERFIAAVAFSVARGYHNLYEEREDHGSGQGGGQKGTGYQSAAERRESNNAKAFEAVFGASPPGWAGSAAALQCEADRVYGGAAAHLGGGVELLPAE